MREFRRALPILIIALAAVVGIAFAALRSVTTSETRYFAETDHSVRDPFLTFFEENGGVATFGFPLTDAYTTENDTLVQTFQRARLQLTVRGVELAPIAVDLGLGTPADYPVDPALMDFYQSQGGAAFFGEPVGAARIENGLLVQDFERARLAQAEGGEVRLANLGSMYLSAFPPPPETGQASIGVQETRSIRANVSVEQPTIGQGGEQTLYLYAEDEAGMPVADVQSLAVLQYNDESAEVQLPLTDDQGIAAVTFIVPPASPGSTVIVEMHILHGETFFTIETTYIQWW